MSSDLEARVERLEAEVGIDASPDDLPEIRGYQMVKEHEGGTNVSLYTDEEGDYWVDFETEDGACCMTWDGPVKKFISDLEEAFLNE